MKGVGWLGLVVLVGILAMIVLSRGSQQPKESSVEPSLETSSPQPRPVHTRSVPVAMERSPPSRQSTAANKPMGNEGLPKANPESYRGSFRDSLLKDNEGRPHIFSTQAEAAQACATLRMRLPTIRELARLGQARGAKGIREFNELTAEDPVVELMDLKNAGYKLVRAQDPGGKQDQFYYDHAGFREPDKDLQAQLAEGELNGRIFNDPSAPVVHIMQYWSSSARLNDPKHYVYYLGLYGLIFPQKPTMASLVRCVAGT